MKHWSASIQALRYFVVSSGVSPFVCVEKNYPRPNKYAPQSGIVGASVAAHPRLPASASVFEHTPREYLGVHHKMIRNGEPRGAGCTWRVIGQVWCTLHSVSHVSGEVQTDQIHQNKLHDHHRVSSDTVVSVVFFTFKSWIIGFFPRFRTLQTHIAFP